MWKTQDQLSDCSDVTRAVPSGGPVVAAKAQDQLTLPVLLNIACDKLASDTASLAPGSHCQDLCSFAPPYPGSRAMLRIGSIWITSNVNHHVLRARWSPHVIRYCMEKYGWDHQIMDDVAWKQIGAA